MKDLIHADISRCNNYRCVMSDRCARYLQLLRDNASGKAGMISVTRFGNKNGRITKECNSFISLNYESK